ncbi:hypothetical protein B0H10DRAFT_2028121 [Mycena sp. CBHHK59/15]|nr:hypothetical protein B0H10DRAFT_2028121 [Mycena sp. CBHHK59/15]
MAQWANTTIYNMDAIQGSHIDPLDEVPTRGVYAVCGPPTDREIYGDVVNHWRIFFVLDGNRSISLDMVKESATNTGGTLGVVGRNYSLTDHRVIFAGFSTNGITVRTVLDFLEEHGYLRYRYAANGEGCRFWVKTVINALRQSGRLTELVSPNVMLFNVAVEKLWTVSGPNRTVQWAPKAMQAGSFY